MPIVAFESLPDDARAWVFGASRSMTPSEAETLLAPVDAYLAQWKAHGAPLTVGRQWSDARFLTVAVDQSTAGASGCSIDGLFRELVAVQHRIGVELVGGGRVFWRAADGTVHGGTRDEFAAAAGEGSIQPATPVFDTTVTTLGGWRARFERPAAVSWHAQLLPVLPSGTTEQ
jgi:hypothetical protein